MFILIWSKIYVAYSGQKFTYLDVLLGHNKQAFSEKRALVFSFLRTSTAKTLNAGVAENDSKLLHNLSMCCYD